MFSGPIIVLIFFFASVGIVGLFNSRLADPCSCKYVETEAMPDYAPSYRFIQCEHCKKVSAEREQQREMFRTRAEKDLHGCTCD